MTASQGSWQQYEVAIERDVMVPLRDGTRMATDLYLPARGGERVEGRFPLILERTPYNKSTLVNNANGKYFARRGYAVAVQDVRGRYASEGIWYAFADEGPDGYDALEWLAAQDWCNGRVGTMGGSYCGSDQSALACLNPPHLETMIVLEGASNYHTCSMRHNGACEMRFMVYAFRMAAQSREALADEGLRAILEDAYENVGEWVARAPLRPGESPLRLVPSYEQWHLDVLTHGDYDEYWHRPGYSPEHFRAEHADVPTLYLGGWYDSYARATTENFVEQGKIQKSHLNLTMGPWTHGSLQVEHSYAGDADFGLDASLDDYNDFRLRWFDRFLKDLDTGVDSEPAASLFIMGGGSGRRNLDGRLDHGGRWTTAEAWPPEDTSYRNLYLQADGSLGWGEPDPSSPSGYSFDPQDPVPTIGGNLSAGEPVLIAGGYDQRGDDRFFGCDDGLPLAARHDVLVFRSEPLEQAVEIVGPLRAVLWASSSAVDTDFTVKLIDEYPPNEDYPNGFALNLTDSIIRARYRDSREQAELMEPGEVYRFDIVMYPVGNVFAAGHRIRLDVSSSNFPRFDVNPNTGEPLGRHTRSVVAHNRIFHDPEHPSRLVLSVQNA